MIQIFSCTADICGFSGIPGNIKIRRILKFSHVTSNILKPGLSPNVRILLLFFCATKK